MYNIQPIRVAYMKPINLKFFVPFKIINRNRLSNLEKPVFEFSLLYPRKNGLRRKSKVLPSWILRLSNWDQEYFIPKFSAQFIFYLQNHKKNWIFCPNPKLWFCFKIFELRKLQKVELAVHYYSTCALKFWLVPGFSPKNLGKDLSLCHKLRISNPYIFATQCRRP